VDLREGEDATDREIVAAGTAATISSETETLAAAAGPSTSDAKLLQVTDASDFTEGHVYLISEVGETEAFVLDRIDETNEYLYAQSPLRKAWSTAATVTAVELEGTFPTAEAADETEVEDGGGPYAAIWTYTVDGERHQDFQELWLVRYSIRPMIDETDIKRADPTLATTLRGRYSLSDLCILATEDFVSDVRAAGKSPRNFYPSNRQAALRHKALEIAYEWKDKIEKSERHREDYQRIMNSILIGATPFDTVQVDEGDDTSPAGTDKSDSPGLLARS
jgi:hypothetical protein